MLFFWLDFPLTLHYISFPHTKKHQTWDNPGTNELEDKRYNKLHSDGRAGAAIFGLNNEAVWDCHINHFSGYLWSELQDANVEVYFSVLGWDQDSWDGGDGDAPESEEKYWKELSDGEQEAARQICYSAELWNGIAIPKWEVE